eukprot:scaffold3521_cov195-Alexandrium_tamarense.AAC.8
MISWPLLRWPLEYNTVECLLTLCAKITKCAVSYSGLPPQTSQIEAYHGLLGSASPPSLLFNVLTSQHQHRVLYNIHHTKNTPSAAYCLLLRVIAEKGET